MNDELMRRLKFGIFPNKKNRIWTMCDVTLQMVLKTIEEAEENGMVNEQFYLNFEDILNKCSCKDHTTNEDPDIENMFKGFNADK